LAVIVALVATCFLHFDSVLSTSTSLEVFCLSFGTGASSTSVSRQIILCSCVALCSLITLVNKLYNSYKLRQILWFNQSQFSFRNRVQLSNNIDTNRSMFLLACTFFICYSLIIVVSVSRTRQPGDHESLIDFIRFQSYSVSAQEMYCTLNVLAFFLAKESKRAILWAKLMKMWQMVIIKCCCKQKVHPRVEVEAKVTKRYFQDLNHMWDAGYENSRK